MIPYGIGASLVILWSYIATMMCVLGAMVAWPITWAAEQIIVHRGVALEERKAKKAS